jgi:hypothetical protein
MGENRPWVRSLASALIIAAHSALGRVPLRLAPSAEARTS